MGNSDKNKSEQTDISAVKIFNPPDISTISTAQKCCGSSDSVQAYAAGLL